MCHESTSVGLKQALTHPFRELGGNGGADPGLYEVAIVGEVHLEFRTMIKMLESLKYVPNKKAPAETGAQVHRRVGNQ
jgi:hypothetical protein